MESLLLNTIVGFWLVLFGGMAIFPFVIEGKAVRRTPAQAMDDQIISIQPVATAPRSITPTTTPAATGEQRQAA